METSFDEPTLVIQIIEALADPTRRKMLLLMHQNAPTGLTASNLADMLRKKIPTILHHLKSLEELGLAEFKMEKIAGGGREVKHWIICHPQLTLQIDMKTIGFLPENYIINLFEELKKSGETITTKIANELETNDILQMISPKIPDITERHADIIRTNIKKRKDLEHYLQQWIHQEYINSAHEGRPRLQLTFREFSSYFALDEQLTRSLFDKLASSEDWIIFEYQSNGEIVHRLALRSSS